MPAEPQCILCKRRAVFFFREKDRLFPDIPGMFDLWKCVSCGLIFLHPQPPRNVLRKHYPESYGPYADFAPPSSARGFLASLKRGISRGALAYWLGYGKKKFWQAFFYPYFLRIAHYPRSVHHGKILDIGCGSGLFLSQMKEFGWKETIGIDSSSLAVQTAKRHGIDAREGELESFRFPNDHFDAITLHHVFEHFPDPTEKLREIRRILKPGGECIITVPNTRSFLAGAFGKHWFGFEIPRHFYNYNTKNLTSLIERSDLKVVSAVSPKIFATLLADIGYAFPETPIKNQNALRALNRTVEIFEVFVDPLTASFGVGDEIIVRARKI